MNVEELMTRAVHSCVPEDSLATAARIMWEHDCGCVPVVAPGDDGARRVVGMVTDRDVCMAAYTQGLPLEAIAVRSAMARVIFSCRPGDAVAAALTILATNQLRRLPVVDEHGGLVGLLSLADVARRAAAGKKSASAMRLGAALAAIATPHGRRPDSTGRARRRRLDRRRQQEYGGAIS